MTASEPAPATCEHEFTLNVQLTHAWCQKCDLVIPMIADGVRELIAAQVRAQCDDEYRQRNLAGQERMQAVVARAKTDAAKAEREACAQLAEQRKALYLAAGDDVQLSGMLPFADLIRARQP